MLPSPHLGRYWPALLHAASQMFSGLPNISTVRGSDNQTLLSGTCLAGGGPGLNWRGASFPVPLRLCMGSLGTASFHYLNSGYAICWIERTAVGILIICWYVLSFVNLKCVGLCTVVC